MLDRRINERLSLKSEPGKCQCAGRVHATATSDDDLKLIAADVPRVAETAETLSEEADQLAAARGQEGDTLREVMRILRGVRGERREHWLAIGRALERLEDLEYLEDVGRVELDDPEGEV